MASLGATVWDKPIGKYIITNQIFWARPSLPTLSLIIAGLVPCLSWTSASLTFTKGLYI